MAKTIILRLTLDNQLSTKLESGNRCHDEKEIYFDSRVGWMKENDMRDLRKL